MTTLRTTTAVAAVLLALTACGGGDGDASTSSSTSVPPTSSSPSTSSSGGAATAGEYPIPEVATERTRAGAEAFGAFYTRLLGESLKRGDGALIARYTAEECTRCAGIAQVADTDGRKGTFPSINPYEDVLETEVLRYSDAVSVRTQFEIPSYEYIDRQGETVEEIRGETVAFAYGLEWTQVGWRVVDLVEAT